MNGNTILNNKMKNSIDKFIMEHDKYNSLKGFRDYLSDLSLKSIYNYVFYIASFLEYCDKEPSKLKESDYFNYLSEISDRTSSYQTGVYAALKKYSSYLFYSKKNSNNYMLNIKRPKVDKKEESEEIEFLTKTEIKEVLMAIKNGVGNSRSKKRQKEWRDRDYLIFLIFLSTGIRLSDLIQLDVDSIDFEAKQLVINNKDDSFEFPLLDEVLFYLKYWLEKREKLLNGKKENALFISINRERMSTNAVSSVVEKYSSVIPDKHITPQKLRDTFGFYVYNATHDICLTQEALNNHSGSDSTKKYICENKKSSKIKASEIMRKKLFK